MKTNIKTKSGRVSAYGFACGYVETKERSPENRLTLGMENTVYYVRGFVNNEDIYRAFSSLKEARAFYTQQKRKMPNFDLKFFAEKLKEAK